MSMPPTSGGTASKQQLHSQDLVEVLNGETIRLLAYRIYNFRVADCHTYFVAPDEGGFSVWAHNAVCVGKVRKALEAQLGKGHPAGQAQTASPQAVPLSPEMTESLGALVVLRTRGPR